LKTGRLNTSISIYELTSTTDFSGDVSEVWTLAGTVRAEVTQLDGSRFLNVTELVDRVIYKIVTWNNNYANNLRVVYGSLTLYPMRPPTINTDRSGREVITIYGVTKQ
jgi:head-tail adaptor